MKSHKIWCSDCQLDYPVCLECVADYADGDWVATCFLPKGCISVKDENQRHPCPRCGNIYDVKGTGEFHCGQCNFGWFYYSSENFAFSMGYSWNGGLWWGSVPNGTMLPMAEEEL